MARRCDASMRRSAARIESRAQLVIVGGPVLRVLDIVLARPDNLTGAPAAFEVSSASMTKSSSKRRRTHRPNRSCAQRLSPAVPHRFAADHLNARLVLRRRPDVHAIGTNMRRAIHRLHRRVREERHFVHASMRCAARRVRQPRHRSWRATAPSWVARWANRLEMLALETPATGPSSQETFRASRPCFAGQ